VSEVDFSQIVDTISLGILVIDPEGRVVAWNRWMENATGRAYPEVRGRSLYELFPELRGPVFQRNLRSVLQFGNFAYFSQRVHGYLLPMRPDPDSTAAGAERMEQHCVMGPVREGGKIVQVYLVIEDVTEAVHREKLLAELAMKDVLTEAYNRRYFDRRLVEELDRCRRYGRSLGLVMLDLDHFKEVNDLHGHLFGDETLRRSVKAWASVLRSSDILARYGGEEFCVLLPETELPEARLLAERVRAATSQAEVEFGGRVARITASAGVAASRPGDGPDDILRRVDEALYRAKAGGRNRVEAAT